MSEGEVPFLSAVTGCGHLLAPLFDEPHDFAPPKGRGSHVVWRVAEVAPRVAQLEAPLAALRRGSNEVELRLERVGEQRIVWLELHITP